MDKDDLTQGGNDRVTSVAELDDIIGELEMELPNAGATPGTCRRIYCL